MRAHQQQPELESVVCPEREVMGASEAGGMEHEQLYGNQAAQAALCFEPIDISYSFPQHRRSPLDVTTQP